jgi:hypothetical protein
MDDDKEIVTSGNRRRQLVWKPDVIAAIVPHGYGRRQLLLLFSLNLM